MPIYEDMTNDDYHNESEHISKSGLDLIARSPAHFRYAAPRAATRAMEIGTAIHAAVLEPERFASEYMLLRDVKDRRASAYKEAAKEYGSERVLTGGEADKVAGMQEALRSHQHIGQALADEDGRPELTVFTTDPSTGVGVKCRFDWMANGAALDLKKTQDARPAAFCKSVANYGYHVQAAFYEDVWLWETGERLRSFEFAAIEETMPHGVMAYQLDTEAMQEGRRIYREALQAYAKCLESDHWPAYGDAVEFISLPAWAVAPIEEGEIT